MLKGHGLHSAATSNFLGTILHFCLNAVPTFCSAIEITPPLPSPPIIGEVSETASVQTIRSGGRVSDKDTFKILFDIDFLSSFLREFCR